MSRAMNDADLTAIQGLYAGDLQPLADLLALGDDRVHPAILYRLRLMIDGNADQCDWRICVKRHPDLKKGQSDAEHSDQIRTELQTAWAMVRNGALKRGEHDAALKQTAKDLEVSEGTVKRHWGNRKQHILNDIRFGFIDPSTFPSPIAERYDATLVAIAENVQVSPSEGDDETAI